MRRVTKDILRNSRIGLPSLCAFCAVWTLALSFVGNSNLGNYIDENIAWPIDFRVRDYLDLNPELDPRIKIFAYDDSTVSYLDRSALDIRQWADLLQSIAQQKPKTIIIDKIFGIEDVPKDQEKEYHKNLQRMLKLANANIVAGSFVAPKEIKFRTPLDTSAKDYRLTDMLRIDNETRDKNQNARLQIPRAPGSHVYGPYADLRASFKHIGHIHYSANTKMVPYFYLGNKTVLPHFGVFAADQRVYKGGRLFLDEKVVPTLKDGSVIVNFLPPRIIRSRTKSLLTTLQRAQKGEAARTISKGDIVFIIPFYYTGNTDFKDGPFGQNPAAFAHLAFINSVISGAWLKSVDFKPLVIFLSCLSAAFLAYLLDHIWLALVGMLVNAAIFAAGAALFSYAAISTPWFYALMANTLVITSAYLAKSRLNAAKETILRNALDGALRPGEISSIIKSSRNVNLDAREHVVTVMFIDVVGYSLLAENQVPRVAFDQLKALLAQLIEEVHLQGGMVNKTLGDGLLCLFGYNFETDTVTSDHAEKAIACAINIQERNLRHNLQAAKRGEPVYPLRIGVHTASVFLGDLGSGERIDFTAVGNGVNYAKRMEQACEIHSVLFSATTRDLIASLGLPNEGLKKKMISIKHHTNLIEAYEYDPFFRYPEARSMALEAYRQCASLARMEQRFSLNHPELFILKSSVGGGTLINFSATGVSIKIKSHMVKGSTLVMSIDSKDGRLGEQLRDAGIMEVHAEVRWAYSETDGNVHGLLYRNISETQAMLLVEILKAFDLSAKMSRSTSKIA